MSPDLKPIENLRGILAGKVYDQEKSAIENIVKLKKRIKSEREDVQNETIKKLVDSVPNRFVKVIKNKEISTKSTEWKRNKIKFFLDFERSKFLFVVSLIMYYIIIWNCIKDFVILCFNIMKNLKMSLSL